MSAASIVINNIVAKKQNITRAIYIYIGTQILYFEKDSYWVQFRQTNITTVHYISLLGIIHWRKRGSANNKCKQAIPKVNANANVKIIKTQSNTKDPIYTTILDNHYWSATIIDGLLHYSHFFHIEVHYFALWHTLLHFVNKIWKPPILTPKHCKITIYNY